jgi:hypothetical protein
MERTQPVDGTWRRPKLTVADIPPGFICWWRTMPEERRHLYLYGGLYCLVEAFNQGRQDEARRRIEQVERLTVALEMELAHMENMNSEPSIQTPKPAAIVRCIRAALDTDR